MENPRTVRSNEGSSSLKEYTVYQVVSERHRAIHSDLEQEEEEGDEQKPIISSVDRRFSHFSALLQLLRKLFPPIAIPDLPENRYVGRLRAEFVETRRRDLQRWLSRIVRHPILSNSEAVRLFLSCPDQSVRVPDSGVGRTELLK